MKLRNIAAGYSILVGISMLGMWTMLYFSGGIPELITKPVEIGMHLKAEIVTALLLIVGGFGIIKKTKWGVQTYYLSMGMLLYTLIVSPGYYLQKGEMPFVLMFLVLGVMALALIILTLLSGEKFD